MANFLHKLHVTQMWEPKAFFLGHFESFESQPAELSECTEPIFVKFRSISFRTDQPKGSERTIHNMEYAKDGRLARLDIMG